MIEMDTLTPDVYIPQQKHKHKQPKQDSSSRKRHAQEEQVSWYTGQGFEIAITNMFSGLKDINRFSAHR